MNVIQAPPPRADARPGRPAAATLGLVDVDIHPRAHGLADFKPWLSERWWCYAQEYGPRARHGFTGGQPPFPKAQPLACRRDAWPPGGGTPASDIGFLRSHHLDAHGIDIGVLFAGTIFTERIFDINGIGLWALAAVGARDLPIVQAAALFGAVIIVTSNLLVDVVYSILDPRVRLS